LHYVATSDIKPINYERFRAYFGHYPSGSSIQCVNHFGQLMKSKTFDEFDYGKTENLRRYGQEKPATIDVRKATLANIPIALYAGKDD